MFVFITLILHAFNSFAQNSPQDYVDAHNAARAQVGVGPVRWNETVAAYARRYASTRIDNCELEHSMGPYGENIAEGYQVFSGKDAVNFWVSERPNYDHKSNSCVGDECLHYTQVVWRDSVHVGCARVKCKNGWLFITCNYDPPGNIVGQSPY
ncbi:CAP domain [Dillenia turbinata]|uniref:CAP domain n=1 Tax=Dillenia turbinata TaxID=194707 RepID=A0AAN8UT63_9MAGN